MQWILELFFFFQTSNLTFVAYEIKILFLQGTGSRSLRQAKISAYQKLEQSLQGMNECERAAIKTGNNSWVTLHRWPKHVSFSFGAINSTHRTMAIGEPFDPFQ